VMLLYSIVVVDIVVYDDTAAVDVVNMNPSQGLYKVFLWHVSVPAPVHQVLGYRMMEDKTRPGPGEDEGPDSLVQPQVVRNGGVTDA